MLVNERIQILWDELADFEESNIDSALRLLQATLCDLVGARNAVWVGAVRLSDDRQDPLRGWRAARYSSLHSEPPTPSGGEYLALMQRDWERRKVDPSFLLATNTAGAFRAFTFRESLPKEWFESDFHEFFYGSLGVYDVLQVGFPLGPEAESHIVIQRIGSRRAFSVREKSLAAQALRGIKGFHRHLMLSHGLLVSSAPLTPVERRVMKFLLTGASEKEIAHSAELAVTTTHKYVTDIFRKYGVRSRAELMSLWLRPR